MFAHEESFMLCMCFIIIWASGGISNNLCNTELQVKN